MVTTNSKVCAQSAISKNTRKSGKNTQKLNKNQSNRKSKNQSNRILNQINLDVFVAEKK
jgi:hypothetical protein